MAFEKINDKLSVSISAIEITAFPKAELISSDAGHAFTQLQTKFANILSEFNRSAPPDSTVFEILWLPEKTVNQTFSSKPRVFFIVRTYGRPENRNILTNQSETLAGNIFTELVRLKYEASKVNIFDKSFSSLLRSVSNECHRTIFKQERFIIGQSTGTPLYMWDTFNYDSDDTMSSFISVLSQCTDTAVSFQIIPTSVSTNEKENITVLLNQISQLRDDISDPNCHKVINSMTFVRDRFEKPYFYYNISVFGKSECCRQISSKILSLLESGQTKVTDNMPYTLDITREKINLYSHFFVYPMVLNNVMLTRYRNPYLNQVGYALPLSRMQFLASTEELSSFFRLPIYDRSMPSLKEMQSLGEGEQFDSSITGKDNIKIGNLVTGDGRNISIGVPYRSWTQHALIVGMPGTGKTTFAVNILTQFAKKGIPFLAIEPTKSEYRAMIDAIDDLQIFTPGNNNVSPFIINPFIPPKGITVEQYTPSLMSAFKAAFSMDGPLEMIFLKAVNACYVEYGWRQNSKSGDKGTTPFGMFEYILCFKRIMKTMKYKGETQSNIETAGLLRLMNLIEQNANIYDTVHTIPIEDLLSHPTVLELNSIENEEQKALIMSLLLANICIYTKINQKGDGELKNVILIDEAHVLLNSGSDSENAGNSKSTTVKTIQNMILEIRSYGTSIIIADQKPSNVSDDIVSNTNVKISFRLTSPKERAMIAENTDMNENDTNHISKLSLGQAYVYFDKLHCVQLVQTEDTRERDKIRLSVGDKEIKDRMNYWKGKGEQLIPFRECSCSKECSYCSFSLRSEAEFYASKFYTKCLEKSDDKKAFLSYASGIPAALKKQEKLRARFKKEEQFERFCNCTVIRLIRKMEFSVNYQITINDIEETIKLSKKER